jgi:hypothetical protein
MQDPTYRQATDASYCDHTYKQTNNIYIYILYIWGLLEAALGLQDSRGVLEQKCLKTIILFCHSGGGENFRIDRSVVTITVCRACANKLARVWAPKAVIQIPNAEDTPREPLQQKTVWAVYAYIYTWLCLFYFYWKCSGRKPPRKGSINTYWTDPCTIWIDK